MFVVSREHCSTIKLTDNIETAPPKREPNRSFSMALPKASRGSHTFSHELQVYWAEFRWYGIFLIYGLGFNIWWLSEWRYQSYPIRFRCCGRVRLVHFPAIECGTEPNYNKKKLNNKNISCVKHNIKLPEPKWNQINY